MKKEIPHLQNLTTQALSKIGELASQFTLPKPIVVNPLAVAEEFRLRSIQLFSDFKRKRLLCKTNIHGSSPFSELQLKSAIQTQISENLEGSLNQPEMVATLTDCLYSVVEADPHYKQLFGI